MVCIFDGLLVGVAMSVHTTELAGPESVSFHVCAFSVAVHFIADAVLLVCIQPLQEP